MNPVPALLQIPIARQTAIYNPITVEAGLKKLPEKEHGELRKLYTQMIEKGGARFDVRPGSLPSFVQLYEELPNFKEPLDDIKRQIALCLSGNDPIELTPTLLLGPPGVGKTHFARKIAELLATGFMFTSMSSLTAGWILGGASSQWRGARPGKVFQSLVFGEYANPVFVVDEVDKARSEGAYDPLGALYDLLEIDTATSFTDEFAEVPINASRIVWILTANDERMIPEPILNRMTVHEITTPDKEQSRFIALSLYHQLRKGHQWGERFPEMPNEEVLDALCDFTPREMRRVWQTAFGNAKLDARDKIEIKDLPQLKEGKGKIGFVH